MSYGWIQPYLIVKDTLDGKAEYFIVKYTVNSKVFSPTKEIHAFSKVAL